MAEPIERIHNGGVYRVVDEHARAVKAARQLHSVLAELRLKILDLNASPGGMRVKSGLVIGFCEVSLLHLHDFYGTGSHVLYRCSQAFFSIKRTGCCAVHLRSSSSPSRMATPSAKPGRSKVSKLTGGCGASSPAGPMTIA